MKPKAQVESPEPQLLHLRSCTIVCTYMGYMMDGAMKISTYKEGKRGVGGTFTHLRGVHCR